MIEIKNLDFYYTKQRPIINSLNLELSAGNIYGLLGKNGAGKSTLLKNIAGLLFPKRGDVDVLGFQTKHRYPQMLQDIFFIPEEFELPSFTIKQYVDLHAVFYNNFDHNKFYEIIEEFKLDSGWKLTGMSYGQKKKVIIGFGLASNCRLLLMDEPTNGLDIPSKSQFRKIVASSITDDRCFIISTHQVKDVENLIDPILIMDNGKIIFNQPLEQVTSKLVFGSEKELFEDDTLIYHQSIFGGFSVVRTNSHGEEVHMDLELLFNAVTANPNHINDVFKSEIK